jgi:hypothetical protein
VSKTPAGASKRSKTSVGSRSFERRQATQERATHARVTRRGTIQGPLGSDSSLRELLRRVPTAAWVCAAIAFLNAFTWSLIVPPFQGRDEVDHFAYVAEIAEAGRIPRKQAAPENYSPKETVAIEGLHYEQSRFTPFTPAISSMAEQRTLEADLAAGGSLVGSGEAGGTGGEPPFFYGVQTIPYALGGSNVLDKLQLMRLFDVLLGALTALLVFFFLREILPGVPWAATVGAICAALQPQFASVASSVNPDALLYPLSAGIFLGLARGFRRGFSRRQAIVLGVLIALGLVTYLSFTGIAVGALIAVTVLAAQQLKSGPRRRETLISLGIVFAIGLAPVVYYTLRNALVSKPALGSASTVGSSITLGSLWHEISYTWELFLPRLPGMTQYFPGISTWREIWFDRSVGFYGWMDTTFPSWADNVALVIAVAIAALFIRTVYLEREALRARLPEFAGYAVIVLALMAMLGVSSYAGNGLKDEAALGEPRYLLPLLPLLAAIVALAARGAGRRWMPVVGATLVVLFLGHDLLSQLQTIGRYYG